MAKVALEVDVNLGNSVNNITDLEKHIEDLKSKIKGAQFGSTEFKTLQSELVKADSKLKNVQKTIEGVDTAKLAGSFAKLGEGVAGGFAVATNALQLFGKDSEELAAAQVKAQQAIAVVMGARSIAEGVAEGAVALRMVREKAALIVTGAQTVAQRVLTGATIQATAATRAFSAALVATGIGAVVVGLGLLITNFDTVNKYISRAINYIRDLSDKISGGNKIVKGFVEILLLVGSPLVTIIRLINDFSGTLEQFQNGINGAVESVASFADRFLGLGDVIRQAAAPFNFIINGLKSLDSNAGKLKPNIEGLTKLYENQTKELEKNKKEIDEKIRLAKAQGASEKELADLTRQSLEATMNQRKKAYDQAIFIANAIKAQNRELTEKEQELFDKVTGDYKQSQNDLTVFDADQQRIRREKWKAHNDKIVEEQKTAFEALKKLTIDANKEIEDLNADTDEKKLALARKRALEEAKILFEATNKGEKATEEYRLAVAAINNKYDLQEKINLENKNKELAKEQLAARTELNKEIESLEAQHQLALANLQKLRAQTPEEELAAELNLIQTQLSNELAAIRSASEEKLRIKEEELAKGLIKQEEFNQYQQELADTDQATIELKQEEARQKELAATEKLEAAKKAKRKQTIDQSLALGVQFINALTKLNEAATNAELEAAGDNEEKKEEIRKKAFERQKALNIVMAIINTAQAVVAALNAPPPLSFISAGIAAATGAIEIGTIAAQQYQGSSSGGGAGSSNVPSIPSASTGGQNFDPSVLGQAGGGNGTGQMPGTDQNGSSQVQVVVLESDITNKQNKVKVLESNATFK